MYSLISILQFGLDIQNIQIQRTAVPSLWWRRRKKIFLWKRMVEDEIAYFSDTYSYLHLWRSLVPEYFI